MVRIIELADDTYRRLMARRGAGGSIDVTIERLMRAQKKDPMSFVGHMPKSDLSTQERLRQREKDRDDSWEDA